MAVEDRLLQFQGSQYLLPITAHFHREGSLLLLKYATHGVQLALQLESVDSPTDKAPSEFDPPVDLASEPTDGALSTTFCELVKTNNRKCT